MATIEIAAGVASYPFYNYRYIELIRRLSKTFKIYLFAGLRIFKDELDVGRAKVIVLSPLPSPRRARYFIGRHFAFVGMRLIKPHLYWLFDTASLMLPLRILGRPPMVVDADDPTITLPKGLLSKIPKWSLIREYKLMNDKMVTKIVVPTRMIKERMIKIGIDAERIEVIPNGVDTRLFKPSLLPDDDVILYYGTLSLHRSKLLIKVVERTSELSKKAKFIVIGDAPFWFRERLAKKD